MEDNVCRELLDHGVVFFGSRIEESSGCGDFIFDVGDLVLKLEKILIGFQIWIAFCQSEDALQSSVQHAICFSFIFYIFS